MSRSDLPLSQIVTESARQMLDRLGGPPRLAMLLGTGHASIAGQLKNSVTIHTADLPHAAALGADMQFTAGELSGIPIVLTDAPLAPYEGYSAREVTFPVRLLRALGAELLVLTAGAASLSMHLEPGSICVVEDHINFSGIQPLQGPPDEQLGPRFPDMSDPYPARWRRLARNVANEIGVTCLPGVFGAVPGPSLPTRAEYRFLRRAGADLVGMSVVPEVLAAVHCGFEVLALVGVTQQVQVERSEPVDIESMLDAADIAAPRMASMLLGIVERSRDV